MNTMAMAMRRVVDIWDCPACGAIPGQRCFGLTRPATVHQERFPVQFKPEQMVRTAKTVKVIARIRREDLEKAA